MPITTLSSAQHGNIVVVCTMWRPTTLVADYCFMTAGQCWICLEVGETAQEK